MTANRFIVFIVILCAGLSGCQVPEDQQAEKQSNLAFVININKFRFGKDFILCLETNQNRIQKAFVLAPRYNTVPHQLKDKGIRISKDSITGKAAIILQNDIFSAETKPLTADINLELHFSRGLVTGMVILIPSGEKFAASGKYRPPSSLPADARIHLHLDKMIVQKQELRWQKCGNIDLIRYKGAFTQVLAYSDKSKSFSTWAATATPEIIDYKKGALTGIIYTSAAHDDTINQYTYQLNLTTIDTLIAGYAYYTFNGSFKDTTLVAGYIAPLDSITHPGKVLMVDLHQALEKGKMLRLFLNTHEKRIISALAITPYNYTGTFSLDYKDLVFDGQTLQGKIWLIFTPDALYSKNAQPASAVYFIDAHLNRSVISGYYEGTYDNRNYKNVISGEINLKMDPNQISGLYIHLDNALFGGSLIQNKVFINLTIEHGKVTQARCYPAPEDPRWTAEVTDQKIRLTDDFLNGHFIIDVRSDVVSEGRFHISIESQVVGNLFIGRYKCFNEKNFEMKKQGNTNGALIK